ncbi:MAG: dethiobiotin synthase [Proteobacteria bacterium]|nr:dethiobiotin synthase [Pseudomonadota bacterium]
MRENALPEQFFVTGTDTGVGKTMASAVFLAGIPGCSYWKPIQSGAAEGTDTEWVRAATGLPGGRFFPEAFLLSAPLSPHAAAALENRRIEPAAIRLPLVPGPLVVEGAGGVLAPVNERHFMRDVMAGLGLPVVLVARSTLGTINHTLLSLEALRQAGISVWGLVMNGPKNPGNLEAVEHFGGVRVILEMEPLDRITPGALKRLYGKIRI